MLPKLLQRVFTTPVRYLVCASLAVGLSACGGGGGNARAPEPGQANVGSVALAASAATIDASGLPSTDVTLTAIVRDGSNSAMNNVTVGFTASSGTITNTSRITGANGTVIEKLSVAGDGSLRPITITANAGGKTSNPVTVTVVASPAPPRLLLTASSGTLPSAGTVGVQIRALVINTSNVVVPGAVVNFSTDSGALDSQTATTNAAGLATVNLGTGTDPTNRVITVTAVVSGTPASTVPVTVSGTELSINAAPSLNAGVTTDVTAVLTDSNKVPLANRSVTFSSTLNPLTVGAAGASPGVTDSVGKLVLKYKATTAGTDVLTVRSLGATASTTITTVSTNFTVVVNNGSAATPPLANTDTCTRFDVSNFQNGAAVGGTVILSSSRGAIYSNATCTAAQGSTPMPLTAGLATAYVMANSPGVTTISATSSVTNSTAQGVVEFVAPLTPQAIVTMQATPAVVGVNTITSNSSQSTLRAVVTDRASQGNPVKGAKIAFSIVNDPSGGTLSQPSEVLTGADGAATVSYIAGRTATAVNGVTIQATIQSPVTAATGTVKLTVAQQALTITAGTGNLILAPNSATYARDYVVFVTDSAGNAVRDVILTGAIRPKFYKKGVWVPVVLGGWVQSVSASCLNEDIDSDGVLGAGEDINGNGHLDPGIPVTITSTATTDATGTAIMQIAYPKDRAHWLDVDFTISGTVAGSEGRYVGFTSLIGAASDYKDATVSPPGQISPYGTASVCSNPL